MALLQNQTLFAQYPYRRTGGANAGERALWSRTERRNVFLAEGWDQKSGNPLGHLAPSSWMLPQRAGAMSSVNSAAGTTVFSASITEGRNVAGLFAGSATFDGVGQTVVSGIGTFAGVASFTGNVVAALSMSGSFTGVAGFQALSGAKANVIGAFAGQADFSGVRYATGSMEGIFQSPVALEASNFSEYLLDQQDIETGMTLREALRLIAAATAGKLNGGGTSTVTIKGAVDDTKSRIVATVDTDGNRTAITYDLT